MATPPRGGLFFFKSDVDWNAIVRVNLVSAKTLLTLINKI